jgi:hypothetical protein
MIVMLSALGEQPVSGVRDHSTLPPVSPLRCGARWPAATGRSGATRRPCRLITTFHLWTTLRPVWMI